MAAAGDAGAAVGCWIAAESCSDEIVGDENVGSLSHYYEKKVGRGCIESQSPLTRKRKRQRQKQKDARPKETRKNVDHQTSCRRSFR